MDAPTSLAAVAQAIFSSLGSPASSSASSSDSPDSIVRSHSVDGLNSAARPVLAENPPAAWQPSAASAALVHRFSLGGRALAIRRAQGFGKSESLGLAPLKCSAAARKSRPSKPRKSLDRSLVAAAIPGGSHQFLASEVESDDDPVVFFKSARTPSRSSVQSRSRDASTAAFCCAETPPGRPPLLLTHEVAQPSKHAHHAFPLLSRAFVALRWNPSLVPAGALRTPR